jgi:hypothetical protein
MAQNPGQMENDLDFVILQLQSRRVSRPQIERDTGLDRSWLTKLSLGLIDDPGHKKITKLAEYFRLLDKQELERSVLRRSQEVPA